MVQRIPLSGVKGCGLYAKVDDQDAECVAKYTWHLYTSKSGGRYARTNVREPGRSTPRKIMMSQLITGKRRLDHANGDGLDNTRRNLREADRSQNGANRSKQQARSRAVTSLFKGVSRRGEGWSAQARYQNRTVYLGTFDDEVMAARAYDDAAVRFWGEFARTNVMLGLLPPGDSAAIRKALRKTSSQFKGVSWHRASGKWAAYAGYRPKIHLGLFADEEDAARAYDEAAVRLHGERAQTNVTLGLLPSI